VGPRWVIRGAECVHLLSHCCWGVKRAGSHFRYGTMNWEAVGDLSGTTATVDIELEIGYRRTYTWGREKLESVRALHPCFFWL
jgi:hypothetical protein